MRSSECNTGIWIGMAFTNPFGSKNMHVRKSKRLFGMILASLAGLAGATAGHAGDTADAPGDAAVKLDEIVVTAQKREQNLQDVGTSVTALDSAALAKLGLKDVTELAMQIPGLQYNQFGATVTVFNLRGVSQNDFSDHQEAPIAVYEDDAYVAMPGAFAGSKIGRASCRERV